MLVGPQGRVVGSISGGCVEGAVYDLAQESILSRQPVLETYGAADSAGFAVGLTCGGGVEVFVEAIDQRTFPQWGVVAADLAAERPVAVATIIACRDWQTLGHHLVKRTDGSGISFAGLPRSAVPQARLEADVATHLRTGRTDVVNYPDGLRIFVATFRPRPRLILFGATEFTAVLSQIGAAIGFKVTVCDARAPFATAERFPHAEEVVVDWPHRYLSAEQAAGRLDDRTAVCLLTHDPKFDTPLLEVALRIPELAYVGAMGSRSAHVRRLEQLRRVGLSDHELAGLCSPVGLDLGAATPEETAVSIAAEIIAQAHGGSGRRLTDLDGPLHSRTMSHRLAVTATPEIVG